MTISEAKRRKIENIFEYSKIIHTFANPFRKELLELILRYGVMVALQILALSVRVRVLLSQQRHGKAAKDPCFFLETRRGSSAGESVGFIIRRSWDHAPPPLQHGSKTGGRKSAGLFCYILLHIHLTDALKNTLAQVFSGISCTRKIIFLSLYDIIVRKTINSRYG